MTWWSGSKWMYMLDEYAYHPYAMESDCILLRNCFDKATWYSCL